MGLDNGVGDPTLPGTKGLEPRRKKNPMMVPSQGGRGMMRSSNGKEGGVEAGLKAEESKWRDGLMGQTIPELPLEGEVRMMEATMVRTVRPQMEGDLSTGGDHVDLGITLGHTGSMIGVGLEMVLTEGQSVIRIRG